MLTHLSLFNYSEMLALLVSIICYKYIIRTPFAILLPYIVMTVAAEFTGKYLAGQQLYAQNANLFNITTVIEFCIFFYLFYCSLQGVIRKKIVIYAIPIYIVIAFINQAFIQGFDFFHTYSMLVGTVLIIIFVFFYFYETFSTIEPVHLLKEPMFWFTLGIFLFYLGDFTNNLMHPYFLINHMEKEGRHIFHIINNNLIIFEYICISIAIIICSRNRSALKLQS